MSARTRYSQLLLALVLLLIVASRAIRLDATVTEVTVDEVWSVWQGLGTPSQIIGWTPYDWTPGYYLMLSAWRALVGLHPVALRWLSALAFAVGAAALYRVARRLHGDGIIAMLAYAAFGYLMFMSTELRGYVLPLALYPLAIWLALLYFDNANMRRAAALALTMAAMVYCTMTSVPALAALALFTLIVRPRAVWRWLAPAGVSVVLALPVLIPKLSVAVSRTQATSSVVLSPFFAAISDMFLRWTGNAPPIWLALLITAAILSLRAPRRRIAIALLVWSLLPAALYVSNPVLGFFNVRYAWWVMPGIALLLGFGLVTLPLLMRAAVAVVFGTLAVLPIPNNQYQIPQPPLGVAFDWLTEKAQPGDVVLIDPNCSCGAPEVFDYYTRVYFPAGLTFIDQPGDQRRIWYVTGASGATPAVSEAVSAGRVASIFVGPPEGLFRLYEAPPNRAGIPYENGMRFHGAERLDGVGVPVYHEGDPITMRLWWTVDTPPPLDYSIALYVVSMDGATVVQVDGPPAVDDAPNATSQWQPGQFYVGAQSLELPYPLHPGHYRLMMAVYWYGDLKRLEAPGVDDQGLLPLLDFDVVSWAH